MEELKKSISNLIDKFDNKTFKEVITETNEYIVKSKNKITASNDNLSEIISKTTRKIKQLESEIERLQLLQNKNANIFSKKNGERIKLARNIIELEQENEDMESKLRLKENQILVLEDEIKSMSYPSLDELYFEIIKGFGVEFIEKENQLYARIKNKNQNDIFLVECNQKNLNDVCEKIWASME